MKKIDPITKVADIVSVTLIVSGMMLFLYGLASTEGTMFAAFLSLKASVVSANVQGGRLQYPQVDVGVPEGVLAIAAVFMVTGIILQITKHVRRFLSK